MTTITFDTDDFDEFVKKWKQNNPLDKHLSGTKIVGRYILKYIYDGEEKNGKKESSADS